MTDYFALSVSYGPGSTLGVIAGLVISYQTDRGAASTRPSWASCGG